MDPEIEAFAKANGLSLGPVQAPGAGQTGGPPSAQQGSGLRVYTGSKYGAKESTVVRGGRDGDALVPGARRSTTGFTEQDEAVETVQGEGWFNLSTEEIAKWARLLYENGHIDEEDMGDYGTLQKMWFSMAEEAGNLWTTGKKAVGIWDAPRFLSGASWLGESEAQRLRDTARAATGFTGSRTSVSKTVNLTDPETARALVNQVLSKALGREANADEVREFGSALSAYESANPSVSTTTQQFEDGVGTDVSTSTTGGTTGLGSEQVLTDKARMSPEYGAFQAAAPLFNALMSAIASPV